MAKEKIYVGIEVGTSKVCAVATVTNKRTGGFSAFSVSEVASSGVRKGEIVDTEGARTCVHSVLAELENHAKIHIESVWLVVTGAHMSSLNCREEIVFPGGNHQITEEDLVLVERQALAVGVPNGNRMLQTALQHYYVDGREDGVENPQKLHGNSLEGAFHIMHGSANRVKDAICCIENAGVEVDDVVVASLAGSQVCIDDEQKEKGVLLMDIGGGVTDYIVYRKGVVWGSGVLAVGGDHVSNDLACGLRIPLMNAERFKQDEASCEVDGVSGSDTVVLRPDISFSGCEVRRKVANVITRARVEELFILIRKKVEEVSQIDLLGAGVVITGGCSRLKGIKKLAEEVFGLPVMIVGATGEKPTTILENPRYSAVIGATKYAYAVSDDVPSGGFFDRIGGIFK